MPPSENLLLGVASLHLVVVAVMQLHLLLGMRRIRRVATLDSFEGSLPSLSIVVAARNEERDIEAGLRSLMELEYSPVQLIVVNDRSTDRTGEIIDRVALEDSRIVVIHLESLPENWLGKNHALQCGAEVATGEYLLFTDADVVFSTACVGEYCLLCGRAFARSSCSATCLQYADYPFGVFCHGI